MKNKFTFATAITLILISLSTPVYVRGASVVQNNLLSNSEREAKIRWVFKTINGKSYKRLFNYETRKWIGDWIPA